MSTMIKSDTRQFYYQGLDPSVGGDGLWWIEDRWLDVERVADLRPGDEVLDVGCAEGLLTLKVAQRVKRVHGVEIQPQRVAAAEIMRDKQGADNATFAVGSACDLELEKGSYDVVLFLGVFHHLPREHKMQTLDTLFKATRRQMVIRVPVLRQPKPHRLANITGCARANGFACRVVRNAKSYGGDLIIATRAS